MAYYLGLDLGTSGLKGLMIDEQGQVVASETANYAISVPESGFSEQNPADWLTACDQVFFKLKESVPDFSEKLSSISFSGQMHSLVMVAADGSVLHPAILWNDGRSTEECRELMFNYRQSLMTKAKNRALEGFTLPKLMWIKKNKPAIWEKIAKFMMPKDYLSYYLTGRIATDYSDASGTLLLNMSTQKWDEDLLTALGIAKNICPELLESQEEVGSLKPALQQKYQLENKVKIFAGGADNACAAIGAGVVHEDQGLISIGTSGVVLRGNQQERNNDQGLVHYFHGIQKNSSYIMGVTLSAGYSLKWFKELVNSRATFAEFTAKIKQIPIGCQGLIFTPYLFGERTPYFDVSKRGSFSGIAALHTLDHFIRAIMEGVSFSLKQAEESVSELVSQPISHYVVTGGAVQNQEWLQMIADIFNQPMHVLRNDEGPAFGAALIAFVGINSEINLETCIAKFVKIADKIEPSAASVSAYQKVYQKFVLKSI